MILVGDIGATNARLALFDSAESLNPIKETKFLSKNYTSLISVIEEFLGKEKIKIETGCFGVPGPVKNGRCETTNIPWIVDINEISKYFNISKAYLLNDVEANAYGISCLKDKDFYVLNIGEPNSKANACILAAGTGLGEAGLFYDGKRLIPFASEGGHTDFGPQNDLEIELLKFLSEKYGHVSYESVLSGPGIFNLYQFLLTKKIEKKDKDLEREIQNHAEPQVIITKNGLTKESKLCEKVLDWFISIYGAEAGNAALKYYALGGVYIGGGIAPKILEKFKNENFMNSFINKGKFSNLLMSIPVKIILNDNAALLGAKQYALLKETFN